MDQIFPLPERRAGWFAWLVTLMLVFLIYYGVLFDNFLRYYEKYFVPGSFIKSADGLIVSIESPRYYFSAGPTSVYVYINNTSPKYFEKVLVTLETKAEDEKRTLPLVNVYGEAVNTGSVEFPFVQALSTSTGRISLLIQSRTRISAVHLKVGDQAPERLSPSSNFIFIEKDVQAFQLEILEHVLLPPWSNVFLIILATFSSYLAESAQKQEDEHHMPLKSNFRLNLAWWRAFGQDLVLSLEYLILLSFSSLIIFLLIRIINIYTFSELVLLVIMISLMWSGLEISGTYSSIVRQTIIFLGFAFFFGGAYFIITKPEFHIYKPTTYNGVFTGLLALIGLFVFLRYSAKYIARQTTGNESSSSESIQKQKTGEQTNSRKGKKTK